MYGGWFQKVVRKLPGLVGRQTLRHFATANEVSQSKEVELTV
jgi:hypothetical protein